MDGARSRRQSVAAREGGGQDQMDESASVEPEVRPELLRRLAEQAMNDPAFRASARVDLDGALSAYGYELNERELTLVRRFRRSLADAGVDLDLVAEGDEG
jgi:hypothetical protein